MAVRGEKDAGVFEAGGGSGVAGRSNPVAVQQFINEVAFAGVEPHGRTLAEVCELNAGQCAVHSTKAENGNAGSGPAKELEARLGGELLARVRGVSPPVSTLQPGAVISSAQQCTAMGPDGRQVVSRGPYQLAELVHVADARPGGLLGMPEQATRKPPRHGSGSGDATSLPPAASGDSDGQETDWLDGKYRLDRPFSRGAQGEVWKAFRTGPSCPDDECEGPSCGTADQYILKRIMAERGPRVLEAGLREVYFGSKLLGSPRVARFVEYFNRTVQVDGRSQLEVWLVFVNEGKSLNQFLYTAKVDNSNGQQNGGAAVIYEPSDAWRAMRTKSVGVDFFRELMRQLLEGLSVIHNQGVAHRDLKPQNLILQLGELAVPELRLADFGSAIDTTSLRSLYGPDGPTQDDETLEYAPPEVLFHDTAPFFMASPTGPLAYDMWSVGTIAMELLLADRNVWTLDDRARAVLQHWLKQVPPSEVPDIAKVEKEAALRLYCIFVDPPPSEKLAPPSRCGMQQFIDTLTHRDPLKIGFGPDWQDALRFVWMLLRWDPMSRVSASEALGHHFLSRHPRWTCNACHSEFDLQSDLRTHIREHHPDEAEELLAQAVADPLHRPHVATVVEEPTIQDVSTDVKDTVDDTATDETRFRCEGCGRKFDLWHSCDRHATGRSHGSCFATPLHTLPRCVDPSAGKKPVGPLTRAVDVVEATLDKHCTGVCDDMVQPLGDRAGWCGLQGRRVYMEDMNQATWVVVPRNSSTVAAAEHQGLVPAQYYAVFDGHSGIGAATYAAERLHVHIHDQMQTHATLGGAPTTEMLHSALQRAFADTESGWLQQSNWTDSPESGCTATVALLLPTEVPTLSKTEAHGSAKRRLLIAHVGDSRAVQCCDKDGRAIQLTVDHTPAEAAELARVQAAGGFVEMNGVLRVQGKLAVTRSIGDRSLKKYLSAIPDIIDLVIEVPEALHLVQAISSESRGPPQHTVGDAGFLVLGSDGLFDVLDNDQVVDIVQRVLQGTHPYGRCYDGDSTCDDPHLLHLAAQALAHEAYVRGSSDNIGAYVVDLAADRMAL